MGEEETKELTEQEEKLAVLIPIAQEIIKIIGQNTVVLGDISKEDREPYYKEINSKILDLLTEKDFCIADIKVLFSIVLQAYETVSSVVENSINLSYELARKKLFGKDVLDIRISDLDKILKS